MAPLSRAMLWADRACSVLYGLSGDAPVRVGRCSASMPDANFRPRSRSRSSPVSFFGSMMTAVLPLISPEKGAQLGFVAQGSLVVSGVYYPVSVLPEWMYGFEDPPATMRCGDPAHPRGQGSPGRTRPLIVIGVISILLGLAVFKRGEIYARSTQAEAVGLVGNEVEPAKRPIAARPGGGAWQTRPDDLSAIVQIAWRSFAPPAGTLSSPVHRARGPEVEGSRAIDAQATIGRGARRGATDRCIFLSFCTTTTRPDDPRRAVSVRWVTPGEDDDRDRAARAARNRHRRRTSR
jgi:ABC-2 type transport system permease protein